MTTVAGELAPVSQATVQSHIGGDFTGTLAVGHHNTQVGSVHGDLVVHQKRRPTVEARARPLDRPPSPFDELLGREPEVASAVAALERRRRVGFHGPRGVGRTSVLRYVSHHRPSTLADGVMYCSGRGQPLGDLLLLVFDGFYDAEMGYTPRPGQVAHYLSSVAALVVVDDLEVDDEEVDALVSTMPQSDFLWTSVQRSVWDTGKAIALEGLPEDAALALLERTLDRPISEDEREPALQLCRAHCGHPRRIVQAVAAVVEGRSSLAELAAQTGQGMAAEVLTRSTVAALTTEERNVLSLVAAVEPAALPVDRIASVTGLTDVSAVLESLRRKQLVQAHSPRYSLATTLPPDVEGLDSDDGAQALMDHYLDVLARQRKMPERFADDVDAIRTLVSRAASGGQWSDVVGLVRRADPILAVARRWEARDQLVRQALVAARSSNDSAAQGWCHHQLGTRALWLGEDETARQELNQAFELRRRLGDWKGAQVTQFHLDQLSEPPPPGERSPEPRPRRPRFDVRRWRRVFLACVALFVLVGIALLRSRIDHDETRVVPLGETSLAVKPTSLDFGERSVGSAASAKTVTLANRGTAPFVLTGGSLTGDAGPDYAIASNRCRSPIPPERDCTLTIAFTPSAPGDRVAALILDVGGDTVRVKLTGKGTAGAQGGATNPVVTPTEPITGGNALLRADAAGLFFDAQRVGAASATKTVVIRNESRAPVRITSIASEGPAAGDFKASEACRRAPLPAGASCDIPVSFSPTAPGERLASIVVTAEGSQPLAVNLAGTGTSAELALNPSKVEFGPTPVNSTGKPQSVTLTNTGTAAGKISTVSMQVPKEMAVQDLCLGTNLAPGENCQLVVTFEPKTPGTFTGSVTVASDDASPVTLAISATAVAAADLAVDACLCQPALTIANKGPSSATATQVVITGTNVSMLNAMASSGTCKPTGQQVICDLGTVPAGNAVTVGMNVSGTGGAASVKATVSAAEFDPFLGNNTDDYSPFPP